MASRSEISLSDKVFLIKVQSKEVNFEQPWESKPVLLSHGTGFLIEWERIKYLVTNYHVVQDAIQITANNDDGKSGPAQVKVLAVWKEVDLALLSVPDTVEKSRQPLQLYKRHDVNRVDQIFFKVKILGFPVFQTYTESIGSVSSYKDIDQNGTGMLQIDVSVDGGNSGGPVIDMDTQTVVGIVVSGSKELQGFNFAIPSWKLENFLHWYSNGEKTETNRIFRHFTPVFPFILSMGTVSGDKRTFFIQKDFRALDEKKTSSPAQFFNSIIIKRNG